MKTFLTLSFLVISTGLGYAQNILTADNRVSATQPPVYKTLTEAIGAATSGDHIYVMPSPVIYGNIIISKQVSLFGTGFNPVKEQANILSRVSGITLQEGATDVRLTGLVIGGIVYDVDLDGLLLEKCQLTRLAPGGTFNTHSNVVISNCIFSGLQQSFSILEIRGATSNFIVKNNIFFYWADSMPILLQGAIITNNIFTAPQNVDFGVLEDCEVSDNIFVAIEIERPGTSWSKRCIFNNNIFTLSNDPLQVSTNTGSNNLLATDPLFDNFLNANVYEYSRDFDFHLRSDSPGKNGGTDGTDIGIYGGNSPFIPTGVPLPIVQRLNVVPLQVAPGEDLEVEIKARSY